MDQSPIWTPNNLDVRSTKLWRFMEKQAQKYSVSFENSEDFYRWSVEHPEKFWSDLWEEVGILGDKDPRTILKTDPIFYKNRFFEGSTLNYGANLLKGPDHSEALVFWGEDQVKRRLTMGELRQGVATFQNNFKKMGVGLSDRVAAFMPNMPETIQAMIASASLGAIWASCSPDFGVQGVLDRFSQIEPKSLITVDGYYYKGKIIDLSEKIAQIVEQLPSLQEVIVISYVRIDSWRKIPKCRSFKDIERMTTGGDLTFVDVPFNHPLFIMFSSGTTGAPKCIVHGHGGTLIQHMKEHQLHSNIQPQDRVFYYTTCGWMMWNWLATALASQAVVILYDGSPFYPSEEILFDLAASEKVTFFGVSAKYIDALHKAGINPSRSYDLSAMRTLASTGSPLMPENYDYIYEKISKRISVASISGGTDIVSCFALGDPTRPVYRGELQTRGFGMAVEVWDEEGHGVVGQKGELVCTRPFPCMPIGFWNDPGDAKYHNAYFDVYPNIWCHGDFCELTEHGGLIIYGRSDTVLNPGGVRIGTAEIYRQVEKVEEVLESIAVGQNVDGDVRVVLFVRLASGVSLNDDLMGRIKQTIKIGASPRHVPDVIKAVQDIPRTVSGKISEKAVSDMIHGRPIKNKEALANPESLELYRGILDVRAA